MARSAAEIERDLEQARAALEAARMELLRAIHRTSDSVASQRAAYQAARGRISAFYRELAAATGEEYVVSLDIGVVPEAAVSGAFVMQAELRCVLTFNTGIPAGEDGRTARPATAVVEFHHFYASRGGLPNDEALPGHPLYRRGLEFFRVAEVLNSSWARSAEEQNRICFPRAEPWEARHFIFSFHDSSFECLARGLSVAVTEEPHEKTVLALYRKLP